MSHGLKEIQLTVPGHKAAFHQGLHCLIENNRHDSFYSFNRYSLYFHHIGEHHIHAYYKYTKQKKQ